MNILYALNDNFVVQTGTSIYSLCCNNIEAREINFYIFSLNVSNKNKKKLKDIIKSFKRNIKIIELENLNKYFDFEFDTSGWPQITLGRLLMGKLLPNNIKKVLYIDGDTIIRGSLEELWNNNLDGKTIGASIEPTVSVERREKLGLYGYPYYNAGVLLVNLQKWRDNNTTKIILDYYKQHDGKLFASDQDAINGSLKDEICTISMKYNYYNIFDQYPYKFLRKQIKDTKYLDKSVYIEAKNNPIIIHYLGEERPWRKGNRHRFKQDYYNYLNKASFKDNTENGWKLYFICWNIFNIITKPFPSLRLKIINNLIPTFIKYRGKISEEQKK